MKRKFLFVPMFAALMVASSCSKDENTEIQNEEPQPVTVQVQKTYPITIKASKKSSISKVGLGESTTLGYEEVFDRTDELVLSWGNGEDESVALGLTGGDGTSEATFSGDIPESADGKIITAYIGEPITEAKTKTSYASLAEAVNACSYLVSNSTFEYKAGEDIAKITLDEQNAFIEITMSTMQHTLSFCGNDYTLDGNGKVWVAVAGGTSVYANFFDSREVAKGTINTINRAGLVDLGISDGILWTDANVSGQNGTVSGDYCYYTFDNAGKDISSPLELPKGGPQNVANNDFAHLYDQCYWVWTGSGYNIFKSKDANDYQVSKGSSSDIVYDASTDPHIFFPAAGYINISKESPEQVGTQGMWWSSVAGDAYGEWRDDLGYYIICWKGVSPYGWNDKGIKYTVRAVRRK